MSAFLELKHGNYMQEFDTIRPYSDEETPLAIHNLVRDGEFLNMISRFKAPGIARWAPGLIRFWIRRWLIRQFGNVTRVNELQTRLSGYVGDLVSNTTSQVTHSGLENLDPGAAYLFISNHRDIVFDPMVVNYLLFNQGFDTTRIAIGDNLLSNRVFAEMMRLNKSFVVRRNMTSPREMRDAYLTLSRFINHSIDQNQSIWIAQREGRAKDGFDRTDPAIIKMCYMASKKSGLTFAQTIARLRIVPVSIAYEYDPCDSDKARELETRARTGQYAKTQDEDTESIIKGLTGFKGQVHVHFGLPITDPEDNPKALAARIDHDMHANYHLHSSNLVAYRQRQIRAGTAPARLCDRDWPLDTPACSEEKMREAEAEMEHRLKNCDPAEQPYLLDMYANPVVSALAAAEQ